MARRIIHQLVDDIDGTVLGIGEGESVSFSLNGTAYEIDLSSDNAAALRDALEPYIAAARRSPASRAAARTTARRSSGGSSETAAIREWALANGHQVSSRGRIPAPVVDAYHAAN